jgi:ATP synthase I chain
MTSRASAGPSGPRGPLDATLRTTLRAVAACGAALALGSLVLLGPSAALSAAIGAALAAGNLWALARIVVAFVPSPAPSQAPARDGSRPRGAGAWTLVALVKMLALFSVVWLLMRYRAVSPLSMLLGFAALPLGIAIGSIVSDRNVRGDQ